MNNIVRPKASLITAAVIAYCTLSANPPYAQTMDDFISQAGDHARWVDRTIRARIGQIHVGTDDRVFSQIEFHVDEQTPIPSAYADWPNQETGRIVITAQLVLAFYYFAELGLLAATDATIHEDCILRYSQYAREAYRKMFEESLKGQQPRPLLPPERYAVQYGWACRGLENHYPFPERLKENRDRFVTAAVATIYLHELGHHVYQHVRPNSGGLKLSAPENLREYLQAMCRTREQELRADRFAVHTLIDLGWPDVVFDITIWSTLTGLGDVDPDIERRNTHPSPFRRMGKYFDIARSRLIAKGFPMSEELSVVIDKAIRLQERIERRLPLSPIAGTEGWGC